MPWPSRHHAVRFAILNLIGVALLVVAWHFGLLGMPYAADSTYMTHGITALFGVGLLCAAFRHIYLAEWIAEKLVFLGLVGTVVGFIMALAGVTAETAMDSSAIPAMIGGLVAGMGTALYTTLVGSIGYLWLDLHDLLLE